MTISTKRFEIGGIPAILYGEPGDKAYLFLHGKCGCKEEAGPFASLVCPSGIQVLAVDLPEHGERKEMQDAFNPWTVVPELRSVMAWAKTRWNGVALRANSIGAYFSMLAFGGQSFHKALFVSPILDMERLIRSMMTWADVSETELCEKGKIPTGFGETLSWQYLTWVRENPLKDWRCPTAILYAGRDNLTSRETVNAFAAEHDATLTVMETGEHWFHTPEQLEVLAAWERENL